MRFVDCLTRCLFVLLIVNVGCNSKPPATTAETDSNSAAGKLTAPVDPIIPVKRDVKEFPGNWVIVATAQRADNYRWIVKFAKGDDGKLTGEFIDNTRDPDPNSKPEFVDVAADGNNLTFTIKHPQGNFEFEGRLEDGIVRGTFKTGPKELLLARLLPTDETSLEKFQSVGRAAGVEELEALMKNKDLKPEDFLNFAREFRTSPIAQEVFTETLAAYVQLKFDEAKFRELIKAYLDSARLWGNRWESRTETMIAVQLINTRTLSGMALEHLDAAEKRLGADLPLMKDALEAYREAATANIQIQEIANPNSSDDARAKANAGLTELVKKQPFNSEILFALATYAERTGNNDKAIEYLSDIASLPLLEATVIRSRSGAPPDSATPSELLKKLWTQKHGNDEALAAHLKENYRKRIDALMAELQQKVPTKPDFEAGNKVTLVEMFTGMQSPQSVAPDLGLSAISHVFPTNRLIVIRYHQHIPLPDGLANQDSDERGAFYEIGVTPTIVVDGIKTDGRYYSGPIQSAVNTYEILRKILDPRMADKSPVELKVSAVNEGGQLAINAEATGIPEDQLASCRLRLAIVQDQIDIFLPLASNGIRDREFIVRELLGGANGIAPKKGELKYSATLRVEDIQKHVSDYLTRYEAGRRQNLLPEMKPPVEGKLSLVAWVQNGTIDKNLQAKLVLQSILIPIGGETPSAAAPQKEEGQPAETKPAESRAADAPNGTDAPATSPDPAPKADAGTTPPAPALPE